MFYLRTPDRTLQFLDVEGERQRKFKAQMFVGLGRISYGHVIRHLTHKKKLEKD